MSYAWYMAETITIRTDQATEHALEVLTEGGVSRSSAIREAVLEAAGSSLDLVLKTTVFLADLGEFTAMNAIYSEFFTANPPARSTVQVARLPRDVRIEIEAIALRS